MHIFKAYKFWVLGYIFLPISKEKQVSECPNIIEETKESTVEENIFLGIFDKYIRSKYFNSEEQPLFPILDEDFDVRDYFYSYKDVGTKKKSLVLRRHKDHKSNFTDDEINQLCNLQPIEREDYDVFSSLCEIYEYCEGSESIIHYIKIKESIPNIKIFIKRRQSYGTFTFFYKNNKYMIRKYDWVNYINNLFIPEISLFDHKNISKIYGMFFADYNLDVNYMILQSYEELEEEMIMFDRRDCNHNLIYHILKMVLSAATAIKYLNLVHNRIHGDICPRNILTTKEGDRIIYKLIGFESSFKIGENKTLRMKEKIFTQGFDAPEKWGDIKGFKYNRKCDIWAIGAMILFRCGIEYRVDCVIRQNYYITHENVEFLMHSKLICPCQPNCRISRVYDIVSSLLIHNVENRPNITECIDLLYERLLKEEEFLLALYKKENYLLAKERRKLENMDFASIVEKKKRLKTINKKIWELKYREEKFLDEKKWTKQDRMEYLSDLKTYNDKRSDVNTKAIYLDNFYSKKSEQLKKIIADKNQKLNAQHDNDLNNLEDENDENDGISSVLNL